MAPGRVDRGDPGGVIAAVIQDFGLSDLIHARLVPEVQAVRTPGAAVAGMRLQGWGFAPRPLSWSPPWLAPKALDRVCREGRAAARVPRWPLGRPLDAASTSGGDGWFQERALAVWAQAGSDPRVNHLDTPRVSRPGASVPASAAPAMTIPHGSSPDHRPDLPQAGWARMGSPDGGVPGGRPRWEGHPSDLPVFQARAQAVITAFEPTPSPRYRGAAAPRSHADQAPHLQPMGGITRLAHTLGVVSQVITHALTEDRWHPVDDHIRSQRLE